MSELSKLGPSGFWNKRRVPIVVALALLVAFLIGVGVGHAQEPIQQTTEAVTFAPPVVNNLVVGPVEVPEVGPGQVLEYRATLDNWSGSGELAYVYRTWIELPPHSSAVVRGLPEDYLWCYRCQAWSQPFPSPPQVTLTPSVAVVDVGSAAHEAIVLHRDHDQLE